MLLPNKPVTARSIAVKIKACEDCGAQIEWTTRGKQVCVPCRNTRRRATYQPTGDALFKPTCSDCGQAAVCKFVKGRWYGRRCGDCGFKALRRKQRASMATHRRKRGVPEVKGRTVKCSLCASEFPLNRKADAKFCPICRDNLWRVHPQKRINLAMSNRIRASIKAGSKNGRKWEQVAGYSLGELKAHLESQFLPGMTWDNHGAWHIDHIRPLCSFDFQTPDCPQFREAWALSNLQPLWAKDNLSKGGRWTS